VILPLRPFAWREIKKIKGTPWLCRCFETASVGELVPELEKKISRSRFDLFELLKKGGYPPAALAGDDKFLHTWFEGYRQTYLERDVRRVQNIANLLEFSKLLIMISTRSGGILSKAELGRDAGIPASTLNRYLSLLEATFQVTLIPPYHTNIAKRQTKSPKIFWSDTGMALYLMDIQSSEALRYFGKLGSIVETFVISELQKLVEAFLPEARLFYWRTHSGLEVDAVIVKGLRILPIEVKASHSISREDLKSLKQFLSSQRAAHCPLGLIFYLGSEIIPVASNILACPIQVLLA
jgi:predicted AAA+ superfamily ATPase